MAPAKSEKPLLRKCAAKQRLSRDAILRAALELIDAKGMKALTMRLLGRKLGVEAMSLYYYFKNRDDLLDGVVEAMVMEIVQAARENHQDGAGWKENTKCFINAYRSVGRKHPEGYILFAQRPLRTEAAKMLGKQLTDSFISCGLSFNQAVVAYRSVTAFVGGFVLLEASGMRPAYTIGDMDAEFEAALNVIIAGIEQELIETG